MKKTLAIGAMTTALLAVVGVLSYLEILMFKAMKISVNGIEYVEWLTGLLHTYWPFYAATGVFCIAVFTFCAKELYEIYSELEK